METSKPRSRRRYELDWLRVLAILTIFVFHTSRFFDMDGWHVKNATRYFGVQVWIMFLGDWIMPLIFVISGASLFFALGSRGVRRFVEDKVLRLLVPLVVGVFTHVMLGVYLERVTTHQFSGSFFAFIPHYFEGWYGFGGNFAWMGLHLWYLLILFVFSLLLYPLFRWLRGGGQRVLAVVGDFLALPGAVYLLGLPTAGMLVALNPHEILGMRDFGGWPLPIYLFIFVYGFIVMSHEGLQKRIQQQRWISLAAGVAGMVALLFIWAGRSDPIYGTRRFALIYGLFGFASWCWILTFVGLGFRYLTRSTRFLTYANEAVLPFYIMHQTVLLGIGYYVTRWPIPDLAKAIIIGVSSFATIMILYEFVVRRVNVLRVLFGMKPRPVRQAQPRVAVAQ